MPNNATDAEAIAEAASRPTMYYPAGDACIHCSLSHTSKHVLPATSSGCIATREGGPVCQTEVTTTTGPGHGLSDAQPVCSPQNTDDQRAACTSGRTQTHCLAWYAAAVYRHALFRETFSYDPGIDVKELDRRLIAQLERLFGPVSENADTEE